MAEWALRLLRCGGSVGKRQGGVRVAWVLGGSHGSRITDAAQQSLITLWILGLP